MARMKNEPQLRLYRYRSGRTEVWIWRRGPYVSRPFASRAQAIDASEDMDFTETLMRLDGRSLVGEIYARAKAQKKTKPPYDYWIVGVHVCAPFSGYQYGELGEYEIPEGAKVLEMTQEEFDKIANDHYMQHGAHFDC